VTPAMLLVVAYLLGAFPTSYVAGRSRGIDLRQHGSGNLGATNAFRILGWQAAVPIFMLDVAKGYVPAFFFARWDGSDTALLALAYGAAAIVGHVFSIFVRFRGGKGVATAAGVFLAFAPLAVLIGLGLWLVLVAATGYVSVASIAAAASLPLLLLLTGAALEVLALATVIAVFVIYAHRSNIGRLVRGEEHRFQRRSAATPER
jgi:acyl phosphate:glycerol-3-phosphate acyltransferase